MTSAFAKLVTEWQRTPPAVVLFDLDGTLLDTVEDIATALNNTLEERARQPLPPAVVREMIGRGAPMLIARALDYQGSPATAEERSFLYERFLEHYSALQLRGESMATAYPGAREAAMTLARHGIRRAVVTNKQQDLAVSSLEHAGLSDVFELVVGGDTCKERKPAPEPLLHACRHFDVHPGFALMVGDSINDVRAARAAQMPVVCVPYGYNEGVDPRQLPCDGFIETLADLPGLLGLGSRIATA
jgi:phosphoglycolate phosphatase